MLNGHHFGWWAKGVENRTQVVGRQAVGQNGRCLPPEAQSFVVGQFQSKIGFVQQQTD
jgi:hypothetical protein